MKGVPEIGTYYKGPNNRRPTIILFSNFFHPLRCLFGTLRLLIFRCEHFIEKKNRQQPNAGDSVRHEMKWYTDEFFVVSVDSIAQGRWRVGISP